MLAYAHAEENGSHALPRRPAVFLTHASPPSHIAADSELINAALFGSRRNRWVRGGEGFNRSVTISVLGSNAPDLSHIGAPGLSACASGIESVRYDFDRFLLSQRHISLRLSVLSLASEKEESSINRRASKLSQYLNQLRIVTRAIFLYIKHEFLSFSE
jgi:hypothetical protein